MVNIAPAQLAHILACKRWLDPPTTMVGAVIVFQPDASWRSMALAALTALSIALRMQLFSSQIIGIGARRVPRPLLRYGLWLLAWNIAAAVAIGLQDGRTRGIWLGVFAGIWVMLVRSHMNARAGAWLVWYLRKPRINGRWQWPVHWQLIDPLGQPIANQSPDDQPMPEAH